MVSPRCLLVAFLGLFTWGPQAAALAATGIVVSTAANPGFPGENITIAATITSDTPGYVPTGTVAFTYDSWAIPGCGAQPLQPAANATAKAFCQYAGFTFGTHSVDASYGGDAYTGPKTGSLTFPIVSPTPGIAFINSNQTGGLSVQGATYNGGTITNFSSDTTITLGSIPGQLVLQLDSFRLGINVGLKFVGGAANQSVRMIVDAPSGPVSIAGKFSTEGSLSPIVYLNAPAGVNVHDIGRIEVLRGITLDALQGSYYIGKDVVNEGVIDGGDKLEAYGWNFRGGGDWRSWDTKLHTYGNANNPVSPNFLNNGLQLWPSAITPPPPPPPPPARGEPEAISAAPFHVILNLYGTAPEFINLKLHGDASIWMPSAWPGNFTFPQNNAVVAPTGSRPPGTPEPAYGGGSMIIHGTGSLAFFGGGPTGTNDFVFPGAMVFISDVAIDLAGVTLNQGWTTTGRAFQGIFLEAPSITSSVGTIKLFSNDLNWTNFSILPMKSVAVSRLTLQPNGSASFTNADLVAPHLNTYSTIAATAASGGCWVCLVNTVPVDMTHLP